MKKYVLLQAPVESGKCASQIKIINSKNKIKEYIANGYKLVGHIETDLSLTYLTTCLDYDKNIRIDTLGSKIRKIYDILQEQRG